MATAFYNTAEYDVFKEQVTKALTPLNWIDKGFLSTACGIKKFSSIARPIEAVIMLEQYDEDHWVLKGEFVTEGENALCTITGLLRKDLSLDEVNLGVGSYVRVVEQTIAKTRMVRLFNARTAM